MENQINQLEVLLPSNVDAEQMILGVIILDNSVASQAIGELAPGDFYSPRNRLAFSAMRRLTNKATSIDPLTMGVELRLMGKDVECDMAFIASLFDGVPRLSNIGTYVRMVKDAAILRRAVHLGNWLMGEASARDIETDVLLDRLRQRVEELEASRIVDDLISSEEAVERTLTQLQQQWESGGELLGMPTGLCDLDRRLSGIRRGKYILLAGTPGMGKTTLALNWANNFELSAPEGEKPVGLVITLEMPVEELKVKLLSVRTSIPTDRIETGRLSDQERAAIRSAASDLATMHVEYIEGFSRVTASGIMARVGKVKRKYGRIDYLIIDYLQLLDGEDGSKQDNNENAKLTEISRILKRITIQEGIPVIALSQLNRAYATRSNKDPELSDLRGSGSMGQDADIVIFIAPEDHANPDEPGRKLLTRKFRGGQTGVDHVVFFGAQSQFANAARNDGPAQSRRQTPQERAGYQSYIDGRDSSDDE